MVAEVRRSYSSRMERQVIHIESTAAWRRVHRLGNRIHLAVVAERPDVVNEAAGELVTLAGRALRQLGEGPEAA